MIKFLVILCLWFYMLPVAAQQQAYTNTDSSLLSQPDTLEGTKNGAKDMATLPTDTLAIINEKSLEEDSILHLGKDKNFSYVVTLDSMLKKLQAKEKKDLNSIVKKVGFWQRLLSSGLLKLILWALAIIFILIIVYNIFLNNVMFRKKSRSTIREEIFEEEQFFLLDYDVLVRQSYRLEDYRMATRYLFLKTLRSLAEKSMINYDASKTNKKYLQEIPPALQPVFTSLLLSYERIWYGHSAIPQDAYQKLENRFTSFLKNI